MNLLAIIAHHGYAVIAVALFVACCGLPLPVSVVLLTAGALAAHGPLNLGLVLVCAVAAALSGDTLMYFGGPLQGQRKS
jgi:membrane-associated protein